MTLEQQNFIRTMTDGIGRHEEWLVVMQFGMPTLLEDPPMLAELLAAEATKLAAKSPLASRTAADELPVIMRELFLKFEQV